MLKADPQVAPVFWNQQRYDAIVKPKQSQHSDEESAAPTKKIRIGYFNSYPNYNSTNSAKRAVKEAVEKMTALGYETVEVNITKKTFAEIDRICYLTTMGSMGQQLIEFMVQRNEKLTTNLKASVLYFQASFPIKALLRFIITKFVSKRQGDFLQYARPHSLESLDVMYKDKVKLMQDLQTYLFKDLALDAIIMPAFQTPAYTAKN